MLILSLLVLLVLLSLLVYHQVSLPLTSGLLVLTWGALGYLAPVLWSLWLVVPLLAILLLLNLPPLRRVLLARPVFAFMRKAMPPMSVTEQEALESGTTWWEKELFSGKPDWEQFAAIELPRLSAEEQSFLDNEVEALCAMLDEWDIHHNRRDLPPEVWQYIKDKRFFGMIIPREYGGLDFSPYAQSRIVGKIASRSSTTSVTVMVPNSLGPGELLMKYGTDEQKQRWLPGLARGEEIPCFGLTGPEAGSDAGSIPDTGIVCRGTFEGREVLGLKLTFNKRWITLAPVATVVGLAFKVYDPEGLLGDPEKVDYGITCALLPAHHPGVIIGRRHNPGSPFMNGPIEGKDVFIPADWIIGGPAMAGKGWRMLIECLGAGRGVSLPALATASGEACYRNVGAFAAIRRQFNTEIGKFEGVQEATAEIAAGAYTLEAMRQLVTRGLDSGAPSVMTAMAKYHATEIMRTLINHSMDVVGGRAIQQGPRNFLALPYQSVPVAITVEGANILTRSLMIFGQGAMRCHPYLFDEIQTMHAEDPVAGLRQFDRLLIRHLGHVASRSARTKWLGVTRGLFSSGPKGADRFSRCWYRRINLLSSAFAMTADVALAVLGGNLKRRELLSARLGDVHSQLFIACAILKYRATHEPSTAADVHAEYALTQAIYKAQEALFDFYANFPARLIACGLKLAAFPWGRIIRKPGDELIRKLGDLFIEDNPVRQDLAQYLHISTDPTNATGRLEHTFALLQQVTGPWQVFSRARNKGELAGDSVAEQLQDAVGKGLIAEADVPKLLEYDACRYDAILTDAFDRL